MDETPVATVTAAFDALERGEWRSLAAMIDPASLAGVREHHLGFLVAAHNMPSVAGTGGGSFVAMQSPSGDALERYGSLRIREIPGSPTIRELTQMSPEDFFVRWQQACRHVPLWARGAAALWRLFHREEERDEEKTPVVIGAVAEGDDVAHVVYRQSGYVDPWRVQLITVKRGSGGWRIELDRFQTGMDPFQRDAMMFMTRTMFPSMLLRIVGSWFGIGRRKRRG
jgi:hypothetical protein